MVYGTTMALLVTLWYVLFIYVSVSDSMPSPTHSSLVDTSNSCGRGKQCVRHWGRDSGGPCIMVHNEHSLTCCSLPDDSKGVLAHVASYALNYPDTFSGLCADPQTSAVSLD